MVIYLAHLNVRSIYVNLYRTQYSTVELTTSSSLTIESRIFLLPNKGMLSGVNMVEILS